MAIGKSVVAVVVVIVIVGAAVATYAVYTYIPGNVSSSSTSTTGALTPVTIGLGNPNPGLWLWLYTAVSYGFFKQQGLSVTIVLANPATATPAYLTSGQITIAAMSVGQFLNILKGGKQATFFLGGDYSGSDPSIVVSSKLYGGGVTNMSALNHHTIAGTTFEIPYIKLYEEEYNLNLTIDTLATHALMVSALKAGLVDSIAATIEDQEAVQVGGFGVTILDIRTAPVRAEVFGSSNIPYTGLAALPDYINANPKTIQALTNAEVEAINYGATHSITEIANKIVSANIAVLKLYNASQIVASVDAGYNQLYSPQGYWSQADWQSGLSLNIKLGLITASDANTPAYTVKAINMTFVQDSPYYKP